MKNKYVCDCEHIDIEKVKKAEDELPKGLEIDRLDKFFKILADPTRLKILLALNITELCVCDLSVILSMTKSAVSHQLGALRESNLVRFRRSGKNVYYSLSDECVVEIIKDALKHINH